MEGAFRDEVIRKIEESHAEYTRISDEIWGYAEPRFQEEQSSRLQQEYLKSRGFSIRADLAGEKDGFYRGVWFREAGDCIFRGV